MGAARSNGISRKLILAALLAVAAVGALTATVTAGSQGAVWSGAGQVVFAGPSLDPEAQTSSRSEFRLNRDGSVRSVKIKTSNEMFIAVLGDGAGGSAITRCQDRDGSGACEKLDALLTDAQVTSLHDSVATLRRIKQWTQNVPGIGDVPLLSGTVRGSLEGVFTVGKIDGSATGRAKLRIGRGSTATYACFGNSPEGAVPLTTLEPCIENTGGQLFPVELDVKDHGSFEIGAGVGSMSDILALAGRVKVDARANLLRNEFGGTIEIPQAKASLAGGDEAPVKDEEEDEEDEREEDEDDEDEDD